MATDPTDTLRGMDLERHTDLIDRTVARLYQTEPTFDWVGVYLVEGDALVLGPFRGNPTEHVRIPIGQGVCGSVARAGETEVVPDVRSRPGHIACDAGSRSEIVVPIVREGTTVGVLDVDSYELAAFDATDAEYLGQVARLASTLAW